MTESWNGFLKTAKPDAYARHAQPVDLPRSQQEIGFLPMRLSSGDRDCIVLRKDSSPVTLPIRVRFDTHHSAAAVRLPLLFSASAVLLCPRSCSP